MFGDKRQSQLWLMVESASEHIIRFGTATPSARPQIERTWEIDVAGLPTFTDALQKFERETGIALRGTDCAMAFAGAVHGEQLSLARSRWTITRAGITAVFGKEVSIINTIAARAWAVRSGNGEVETIRGSGLANIAQAGRYVLVLVDQGVGAAVIDVTRGGDVRIIETEAGHSEFPAVSDHELRLAKEIKGLRSNATWEQMLKLNRQSPEVDRACPRLTDDELSRILATILGRFCVNLMHMFGAWQGVIITGARGGKMLRPDVRSAFELPFSERSRFSRLVMNCSVKRVEQQNAVLQGAAECLAEGFKHPMQKVA